jgi:cytochrome c55X
MQIISDKFLLLMVLLSSSMAYSQGNFSPDTTRQDELLHLLKHDCGACHGMRLLGGLGPALTPEALNSKPNQYISTTILEGHAGTPMPPWKLFINNDEADWLAAVLKKGTAE